MRVCVCVCVSVCIYIYLKLTAVLDSFPSLFININSYHSYGLIHTQTSSPKTLTHNMELLKLTVKPWSSCLLLGLLFIFAFLASLSHAEIHYHEFVVCTYLILYHQS